jgi:hypothetical protein
MWWIICDKVDKKQDISKFMHGMGKQTITQAVGSISYQFKYSFLFYSIVKLN